MGIVDEDIERLRGAISIVDVITPYTQLRKTGQNWVGLCPFHAEKTGSFNVRESTGRYRCFGCNVSGDAITFMQEIEHLDFVTAVEHLAAKAGIQLRYTTGGEGRDRQRRKGLVAAVERAAQWYHQRLVNAPDAGPARGYLRQRDIDGDTVRQFRLGWAPSGWDELVKGAGIGADELRESGLALVSSRNTLIDAFRGRLLFPITNEAGEAVAFGGRILPGSTDPAKYKNSSETPIYTKSKTLYGLHWAKAAIVAADQVIVCEGYTDVIGFHKAGVGRAVATCGTALTEDHVRLLKRFAKNVVLAFDADSAGQAAADRFYEWERKYEISVNVLQLPPGQDPADLARTDKAALAKAVDDAQSFLGFRLQRVLRAVKITTPESRARLAEQAMAIVNEHPDVNVRTIYAGQVATHCGLPVNDLVALARRGGTKVRVQTPVSLVRQPRETAEVVVLSLLVHRWNDIAPLLVEMLFCDHVNVMAFRALAATDGDLEAAIDAAEPEARELLERLAVLDIDVDPVVEAHRLITEACRRELDLLRADVDLVGARDYAEVKRQLGLLEDPSRGSESADWLLGWLLRRSEERG